MLFKRNRIPFTIPDDARELSEEEMIQVNGGAEEKKESQESKSESVTVKSGNTLSGIVSDYNKANGTNYTVSDVAKNSGISNPDVIYPGQEIKFGASSSTNSGSSSQGNNPASAQTGGNQGNYSVSNSTNANPGSSVTITNGSDRYSSSDSNFSSPEEFKAKVLSTTGAKDMLANTVGIAVHQLQAGDLICMDTGTPNGKQDGDYSHIQVITGKIGETLGIRQGNLVESPFRTADYGSSSYAGMIIAGRAYDYGRDIFYGSDRTYPEAQSIFGMSFRSWDFDRM